jgi:probable rRNA maturation factor
MLPERRRPIEVALTLADDATIQRLNRDYRGKDLPTNVLSFPQYDPEDWQEIDAEPGMEEVPIPLGDILMGLETVAAEATRDGKSLINHATHLVIHGTLHLLGLDHAEEEEAERMEQLEIQFLATLGIPDPYRKQTE